MLRFSDLKYSEQDLEKDAIHYFETQVYEPSYAREVKEFIRKDIEDFKRYYDDAEYAFHSIYYDEYFSKYDTKQDIVVPEFEFEELEEELADDFDRLGMNEKEIKRYSYTLEAEFRKNAFCSHMEPYFLGYKAMVSTVIIGYSRNPIFSIYSMVREWDMALHFKKMYPQQMRRFGYKYQLIREQFSGEERLKRLIDFKEKYSLTIRNISALRSLHSSVFAFVYLYLKSVITGETEQMEEFILDTSSTQILLLLQGENVFTIDFPVTKYAIDRLKEGRFRELISKNGQFNWDAIYDFVSEAIKDSGGAERFYSAGFEGIAAKTLKAFWNKSANMQKMLKILRRLAMDNSDPIINNLIDICEYRLGRPQEKDKRKMERFIEETRKILAARAYEMTRPRTMAQELIAAFPSVFLVYFQWHHNFRNIYPRESKAVVNERILRTKQADDQLRNKIYTQEQENSRNRVLLEQQTRDKREAENSIREKQKLNEEEKIRIIMQNRENTLNKQ